MKYKSLLLAITLACISSVGIAQDMMSSFANSSNGYIANGMRSQMNGGFYYGNGAGYYTQEGVINRAEIGAAASITNLTASIPGAIMHERDLRLARDAQIRAVQQAFDQMEYEKTGIMSPQMKIDYDRQVALQNDADRVLSPADLAEVKQYRIDEELYRMQLNPNFRASLAVPVAQNQPTNVPVSTNKPLQAKQQTKLLSKQTHR